MTLDLTVEIVPAPATTALIGLGGIAAMRAVDKADPHKLSSRNRAAWPRRHTLGTSRPLRAERAHSPPSACGSKRLRLRERARRDLSHRATRSASRVSLPCGRGAPLGRALTERHTGRNKQIRNIRCIGVPRARSSARSVFSVIPEIVRSAKPKHHERQIDSNTGFLSNCMSLLYAEWPSS